MVALDGDLWDDDDDDDDDNFGCAFQIGKVLVRCLPANIPDFSTFKTETACGNVAIPSNQISTFQAFLSPLLDQKSGLDECPTCYRL